MKDRVIVVTGAGRGIGREIALLAAKCGGKVVVNDLGGSPDGEGAGDKSAAEAVVDEIRRDGGIAVANGDTVAEPAGANRIIQTAIDNFGHIDSVVNNAGILRDRIFHRMSVVDFEMVIKVHLLGSFYVARAAAPYMKDQNSGSFIHFTSTSGLIGNLGQSNYAAAKMGIVGLSKGIAMDMQRFNVRSNCIAPFAWSRLIGTIPTDSEETARRVERLKAMGPDKVAPLAVYLASDLSKHVSGQIFASRMNEIYLFNQTRPIRGMHRGEGWTPETIAEHGMPAMVSNFSPLHRTSDVIGWDPV
ncbi:SDR family NAD(P)-dependent oxidoreductase [Bradyrhizobium iriomotense]|uniref:SDR family NAD(P)-dependent oxidoreductase n=1 Tax=Bradyrhizobium iriomotense TaxID=441950 RepID=UPI001B8A322A|nr:SDR family NAD(P)-dependent oxidoreductase [Bradyrhizobium iriomotense]MBR0784749.1 SDR family oxidoreductase [Bradyrhizobium iriomotense]